MNTSSDAQAPSCAKHPTFVNTHALNIIEHYYHAREKHPYFCDRILPTEAYQPTKADALKELQSALLNMRQELNDAMQDGKVAAFVVAGCEWLEFAEAVMMDNSAAAIEELYDTIAVLLRIIDVLEGRQQLGKQEERGDLCHEN